MGCEENEPFINLYHCSIFRLNKIVSSLLKRVDCAIVENQVVICGKIRSSKYFR